MLPTGIHFLYLYFKEKSPPSRHVRVKHYHQQISRSEQGNAKSIKKYKLYPDHQYLTIYFESIHVSKEKCNNQNNGFYKEVEKGHHYQCPF